MVNVGVMAGCQFVDMHLQDSMMIQSDAKKNPTFICNLRNIDTWGCHAMEMHPESLGLYEGNDGWLVDSLKQGQ